ncbi:MAG TPA: hypothetical protein VGO37_14950 [Steroidobacteraceae bacterium]|jgi:hypothetical protein|nr:hypothetical protein [Steroidobacteraceae bacterium]
MHSSSPEIHSKINAASLGLMLATLWLLMRGYHGLVGDGQIYAFQALARIQPQLAADLYLQNTSQDQFTIFSPFYAWFIGSLGLESAARLLTLLFTAWLMAGAWSFARTVTSREAAWLGVAFLLIIAGDYGGSGVFRFSEQFLTARLPAESLIVTALGCYVRDRKRLALYLTIAALFVHPLIALPGLLVLICMGLPGRVSAAAAIAVGLGTFAVALIATALPPGTRVLTVMDAAWLEVVKERSQFLLLPLWSVQDWDVNIRPLMYLAFTVIALPDPRIRKLCTAAALVGATGLGVALIGSLIGPVAILVQGQAWRWVWVAVFVSAVLLPATAWQVGRDPKCGALCATLLVAGWTLPTAAGVPCISFALLFWLMRNDIGARAVPYFRWASAALGAGIVIWIFIKAWAIVPSPAQPSGTSPAQVIRDIFGLKIPALLLVAMVWWTGTGRKNWLPVLLAVLLAALVIFVLPAAFKQSRTLASASDIKEFEDWRSAIPSASTVLVAPAKDVGAFVWFTLERPNYLALDQSAGVVFSRTTALEVRRRSDVLLPLMDPNWKILTQRNRSLSGHQDDATIRPLTAKSLIQVCTDRNLGFVISPVRVGFDALRHEHAGVWKDWNLYDCGKVRSALPAI